MTIIKLEVKRPLPIDQTSQVCILDGLAWHYFFFL